MIQVKEFKAWGGFNKDDIYIEREAEINELLKELQDKGYKILDIKYIFECGYGMIVYETNDILEDIKCDDGKISFGEDGNLGISRNQKLSLEEMDKYYS